jgi:hypothetical protein
MERLLHPCQRQRPGKLQAVEPVTAEDPKALAKAYTYTRYYEKLDTDIMEDVCEESAAPLQPPPTQFRDFSKK